MSCGGEQMAVVTVDFLEAGIGGAGEMEGVGGAEEDGGRQIEHLVAGGLNQFFVSGSQQIRPEDSSSSTN